MTSKLKRYTYHREGGELIQDVEDIARDLDAAIKEEDIRKLYTTHLPRLYHFTRAVAKSIKEVI